jgi:hypothetical protein
MRHGRQLFSGRRGAGVRCQLHNLIEGKNHRDASDGWRNAENKQQFARPHDVTQAERERSVQK